MKRWGDLDANELSTEPLNLNFGSGEWDIHDHEPSFWSREGDTRGEYFGDQMHSTIQL